MFQRLLRKQGYPRDKPERATETVLQQAELLCADWKASTSRLSGNSNETYAGTFSTCSTTLRTAIPRASKSQFARSMVSP